jgi:2-polyprenyl-3-methyl-5-hydroxy-6-metoxy-1,4-benzoquinol methylase
MNVDVWDNVIRLQRPLVVEGANIQTQEEMANFYAQQMTKFGPSGRALAYPEEELYTAKLEQYKHILAPLVQPTDTLLDVGCGFGSLLNIISNCKYKGIDIVPDFVSEARIRHPAFDFSVQDVMAMSGSYDWVIGLGVTGTVPQPARLAAKMWELTGKGMVIDFIDMNRYCEDLNCFDIGRCLDMFHQWGAAEVRIHSWAAYIWAIFEVRR